MGLRQQKQLTQEIVLDHGLTVTGACKLTRMGRSQYYYVSKKDDSAVIAALDQLSSKHPVYGFRNYMPTCVYKVSHGTIKKYAEYISCLI